MNGMTLMPLVTSTIRPAGDRFSGVIVDTVLDRHTGRHTGSRVAVAERRQRRRNRQGRH